MASLELHSLLNELGQAGKRLSDIGAAEGAAGNLSVCFRDPLDVSSLFPKVQIVELPTPAPDLAGATLIVSGSGRRLRDILDAPMANLACILVDVGGRTGRMFTAQDCPFQRVTSEFNSHLAVHHDQMRTRDIQLHCVLHAQPLYLTFLSHIARYQDRQFLACAAPLPDIPESYRSLSGSAISEPAPPALATGVDYCLPAGDRHFAIPAAGFQPTDGRDHA
jgi:rhamnulose-1-phosphate aldolase